MLYSDQSINASSPEVVASDTGDALVVWRQNGMTQASVVLWARRYSQGAWEAAENIFPGPGNPPIDTNGAWVGNPTAAMDAAGNAFAVWHALRPDLEPSIYAAHYIAGVGWEAAISIEDPGPQDIAQSSRVAIGADGSAMTVWADRNASFKYDIWAVGLQP